MGRNSVSDVSGANSHGFKKNYGTAYDDDSEVMKNMGFVIKIILYSSVLFLEITLLL